MSPTTKRLMKEAAELSPTSPTPSPHFHAHPVDDSNLFEWHFTLVGPPAPSAFANGIYHGRIVLPPTYPLRPPSFRFLTPSGRFEVNREICLSISGHHEESWQPAWGIRTALIAIRSFMDGEAKGQVGGLDAKDDVRREWARKSRSWKCEACGGKTNEEVMKEWWEMCREKGVSVEDEEESVPDELKVGFKDEMGKKAEAGKEKGNEALSPDTRSTPARQAGELSSNATTNSSSQSPSTASTTSSSQLPQPPSIISTPTSTSQQQPPLPATSSTTTGTTTIAPFSNPQPTRTTPVPPPSPHTAAQPQPRATPSPNLAAPQQQQQQRQRQDSPPAWIDRAIIGVSLALLVMILQKFYP